MTCINKKPIRENYANIRRAVTKEHINPKIVLKEAIENQSSDYTEDLYKKIYTKLKSIKHKKDPKLNAMVKHIIDESTDETFENELSELIYYLVQIKEIKSSDAQKIYNSIILTYVKCISSGKTRKEAKLRALITIPLRYTPNFWSKGNILKIVLSLTFVELIGVMCVSSPKHGIMLLVDLLVYFLSGGQYMVYVS